MASTNKTTHYELSQYTASDKPTYLVDYNGDMSKIDTGIYNAQSEATTNTTSIGTLSNLSTTEKSNLVGAINEINTQVGTNTGDISTLNTSVSANTGNIGTMANLSTTDKTSLVNAANEINSNIGDLSLLNTSNKTSIVSAINELEKVEEYPTNEVVIGKWINDKPIYRKVFVTTNTNTSAGWLDYNYSDYGLSNDIDFVGIVNGYKELLQAGETIYEDIYSDDTRIQFDNSTHKVSIKGNGTNYNKYYIIYEYTKTTD